uniref:Solute carrier family 2, facilitated glucose transporter member 2-like n=1 Tax=Sinocyclocheilus rhinocerous TaxID=307959 RepID=A0A673JQS3_9TELE
MQMGYSLGVINAPQKDYCSLLLLGRDLSWHYVISRREGGNTTEHEEPTDASVVMYWSLSVAIFSIGGMANSFIFPYLESITFYVFRFSGM